MPRQTSSDRVWITREMMVSKPDVVCLCEQSKSNDGMPHRLHSTMCVVQRAMMEFNAQCRLTICTVERR